MQVLSSIMAMKVIFYFKKYWKYFATHDNVFETSDVHWDIYR